MSSNKSLSRVGGSGGISADLADFQLDIADVDARALTAIDLERLGLAGSMSGYRLPYTDIKGLPIKHFRVRQLPAKNVPGDPGNFIRVDKDETRIYFPVGFPTLVQHPKTVRLLPAETPQGVGITHKPIFVVDNELQAAYILKVHGLLAVAIQGPSGWQTSASLAEGFKDLCETAAADNLTFVIWIGDGTDKNVQREVANLAMEIKFQGVPLTHIRQYTEPRLNMAILRKVLAPLSLFPRHPNIRQYIQDKLNDSNSRLTRKDAAEIGLAILADMEAGGVRIQSTTTGEFYYFDKSSRELINASLSLTGRELMNNSEFMKSIYRKYGLSPNDSQILSWLCTQFMAEEPIQKTTSYRVMMSKPRQESTFALQVTSSDYVYLNGVKEAQIRQNGDFGVLFERAAAMDVDVDLLQAEIEKQRQQDVLPMWWLDVVKEVRMTKTDKFRIMLSLLYYISPWLKGWKRIQLPVEVITGEAGTGKSSLFSLRLLILTGVAKLPGLPRDMREVETKIVNSSSLLLFDNVHLANGSLKQQISDQLSRIITEPEPTIPMRELYTTANIVELPVQCTFGFTSIENVFVNVDFLSRSIVMHLERADSEPDDFFDWVKDKLDGYGGREAWLAHHIVALERFFKITHKDWDNQYRSKTRLINFEQSLIMMAKVFGLDIADWLPALIQENTRETAAKNNWVLEGLVRFVEERKITGESLREFTSADIVEWAICQDDFDKNPTLTNARKLGKYIGSHKTVVRQTAGILIKASSKRGITYEVETNATVNANANKDTAPSATAGRLHSKDKKRIDRSRH